MKIIVIGSPGSGKSYFARKFSKILDIPVFHLDNLYWQENWTTLPKEEFLDKLREVMIKPDWIIDGNYQSTLKERIEKAQIIFYLNISTSVCLNSVKRRTGKKRPDLPDYLEEIYDPSFMEYIKTFKKTSGEKIEALLEQYQDKKIVISFKTRKEVNNYLRNFNLHTIRYHHLLCMEHFIGHGYSEEFTSNMTKVIADIKNTSMIKLTNSLDDLCEKCPNHQNNKCQWEEKVSRYDRLMKECLSSDQEIVSYSFCQDKICQIINHNKRSNICEDCEWNNLCNSINKNNRK